MTREKSSIGFGLGLIAGVVGGIIAGVLYAPKSGEEAREELKNVAEDFAEKHSPEINHAKKEALEAVDLFRYKLERQMRKLTYMLKSRKLRKAKELEAKDYELN